MGTKIYAVSSGEYSDYSVVALFTTKEKALRFIGRFRAKPYSEFNDVEEYQLDPDEFPDHYKAFFVRMSKAGDVLEAAPASSAYGLCDDAGIPGFDIKKNMIFHCYAEDETHAVKIANEKRAQLIATNAWKDR